MPILTENNVELSTDTSNFYLKKVLEDHTDFYNSMSARIGRNNVHRNLVSNFGRIIAYLTKMIDYCDTEITVVGCFDLARYATTNCRYLRESY